MLDRAGFVGADGPTHHGMYDLTYLRMLPNMTIMVPRNGAELRCMIEFAYGHETGPLAIRYPRGSTSDLDEKNIPPLELGKAQILRKGQEEQRFVNELHSELRPVNDRVKAKKLKEEARKTEIARTEGKKKPTPVVIPTKSRKAKKDRGGCTIITLKEKN